MGYDGFQMLYKPINRSPKYIFHLSYLLLEKVMENESSKLHEIKKSQLYFDKKFKVSKARI